MAGLPASQYFDLNQPFRELSRGKPLREARGARQGFAFDIVNARLFAAQLNAAGSRVCVEPAGKKRGERAIRCAIDPVHERVAVLRREQGREWYTVYDLSQAAAGDFGSVLAHFPQPALSEEPVALQGFAIFGQYLYTLDGTCGARASDVDSFVTRIDMNTGKVSRRSRVRLAASVIFREPEGMAIYRTRDGTLRLFIGFGSRHSLDGPKRYANFYYNDVLRVA